MKSSHQYAYVNAKTSNLHISRRCYTEFRKNMCQMRAARSARLFLLFLSNDTVLWRWRCRRRCRCPCRSGSRIFLRREGGEGGEGGGVPVRNGAAHW